MLNLCRFDHLSSDGPGEPDPEDGLRESLRILARIIARELTGKEGHPVSPHLTEEGPPGLLDHGERGG